MERRRFISARDHWLNRHCSGSSFCWGGSALLQPLGSWCQGLHWLLTSKMLGIARELGGHCETLCKGKMEKK